jgi:iron complex outermembrane recepter protein
MALHRRSPPCLLLAFATLSVSASAQSSSSSPSSSGPDLTELSLEELMNVEVTVASRHTEKLLDAPAAVYVLTGDELRRQGVTTVQEALRMVPGFHVAQWSTYGFDVTSRGFTGGLSALNQSFMNQLLLMVDGVSLYSPVMAGMWWPLLDIPISDIDRIEIIRGPAGTLWGANAMNGVINIITKHARDTQGASVEGTVQGSQSSVDLHYGGKLGKNGWFRTWASSSYYIGLPEERDSHWNISSVGWRGDWDVDPNSRARVLGTVYTANFGPSSQGEQPKAGGWISGTYEFGQADDQQRLQGWFSLDHQTIPDIATANYHQDLQTLDLEYTRRLAIGEGDAVTYGAGGRIVLADLSSNNGYIDFNPERQELYSLRAFVQGEFAFKDLASVLVLGVQVEESTLGDFQIQPDARWLWHPSEKSAVWAAVSRAVRTPSIEETSISQHDDVANPPFFVGNDGFKSETLLAYEIGARAQIGDSVYADVTTFINDYNNLQTIESADPTTQTFGNSAQATSHGAELALDVNLSEKWRLRSSYTWFKMEFEADSSSLEAPFIDFRNELIPTNHASLRSYYDIGDDWEFDSAIYYVDRLSYFDIDPYFRVDARLGWRPKPNLELSLGVQNATDPQHPEAGPPEIGRSAYFTLRATF